MEEWAPETCWPFWSVVREVFVITPNGWRSVSLEACARLRPFPLVLFSCFGCGFEVRCNCHHPLSITLTRGPPQRVWLSPRQGEHVRLHLWLQVRIFLYRVHASLHSDSLLELWQIALVRLHASSRPFSCGSMVPLKLSEDVCKSTDSRFRLATR